MKRDSTSWEETELLVKPPTPLPLGPLFVLCCIVLSESFSITMIFPFIADMVRDFGIAEADIGFYAGWIASSFNIAQFCSSFAWGRVSDYLGRRPVLLIGLFGNFLMIFLFGWSTSLWFAIISRSFNGFLNGNVGVAKTYLAEITDDSNAAKGFSVFGFVWGIGLVIGPSVGGFLSNPHETAPNLFPKGSLLYHFPYLLPCVASSLVTFCGLIAGFFFLPETLPNAGCYGNSRGEEEKPLMDDEKKSKWIVLSLFKSKEVVVTTLCYSIIGFYTMIFDEVFAIWATYGAEHGGISFSSVDIGTSYIIAGVSLLFSQIFIFPFLVSKLGPLRLLQTSTSILILLHPLVPVAGLLIDDERWKIWLTIGPIFALRSISLNWSFTAVMLLVNNSAQPEELGATNGFAQSCCSLFRSTAPTIGGSLLAWSLSNGLGFPFNHYLSFFFVAIMASILLGLSFLLDRASIDFRKTKASEDDKDIPITFNPEH